MSDAVLRTLVEADARKAASAAIAAGFTAEQVNRLVDAYYAVHPDEPEAPVICGNVSKDGNRYLCTRAPHPDEPGNRTPHAFELDDGSLVTWTGPLTFAEQLEEELKDGWGGCGENGCIRVAHNDDMPHLAWTEYHPDPAHGPQDGDPERVLTSW
jgi:hypothetical protein